MHVPETNQSLANHRRTVVRWHVYPALGGTQNSWDKTISWRFLTVIRRISSLVLHSLVCGEFLLKGRCCLGKTPARVGWDLKCLPRGETWWNTGQKNSGGWQLTSCLVPTCRMICNVNQCHILRCDPASSQSFISPKARNGCLPHHQILHGWAHVGLSQLMLPTATPSQNTHRRIILQWIYVIVIHAIDINMQHMHFIFHHRYHMIS